VCVSEAHYIIEGVAMRLFCDQCGTELDATTLRADSRFCSICGKALSEYIKQQCTNLFNKSPKGGRTSHSLHETPSQGAGKSNKKRKATETEKEETTEEKESDSDIPRRTRGRPSGSKQPQTNGEGDTIDETSTEGNQESEETDVLYHFHRKSANLKRLWARVKGFVRLPKDIRMNRRPVQPGGTLITRLVQKQHLQRRAKR
jgi:hypothetical protein